METIKQTKELDCVKMMRDIRDEIDAETADMTFEELRAYLDKQLEHDTFWQRITRQLMVNGAKRGGEARGAGRKARGAVRRAPRASTQRYAS